MQRALARRRKQSAIGWRTLKRFAEEVRQHATLRHRSPGHCVHDLIADLGGRTMAA